MTGRRGPDGSYGESAFIITQLPNFRFIIFSLFSRARDINVFIARYVLSGDGERFQAAQKLKPVGVVSERSDKLLELFSHFFSFRSARRMGK